MYGLKEPPLNGETIASVWRSGGATLISNWFSAAGVLRDMDEVGSRYLAEEVGVEPTGRLSSAPTALKAARPTGDDALP